MPPSLSIVKIIGQGSFGVVFEAFDNQRRKRVALKRVEKVGDQVSREWEILSTVQDCENIVKMLDFFYTKTESGKLIQNIVFEYLDDSLENFINSKQMNSNKIKILNGLKGLHSKGVAHRDLKPQKRNKYIYYSENILIDKELQMVKICDFGSSKQISQSKNTPYIVSRYYRAPELILGMVKYDQTIDLWGKQINQSKKKNQALACIMAEMVLGSPIFYGSDEGDQLFCIFKIMGSPSEQEWEYLAKNVPFDKKIIDTFNQYECTNFSCLEGKIDDYDNFIDLLQKLLKYIPKERLTAEDALNHPFFQQQE